jgi:hypothetical protein
MLSNAHLAPIVEARRELPQSEPSNGGGLGPAAAEGAGA